MAKKEKMVELEIDLTEFLEHNEIKELEQMAKDANMTLDDFLTMIVTKYVESKLEDPEDCDCVDCECSKPKKVKKVKSNKKRKKNG